MSHDITATLGLDVSDRTTHFCLLDEDTGDVVDRGRVATSVEGLSGLLAPMRDTRVVLETGTHSPWTGWLVKQHETLEPVVAQASRVKAIWAATRKSDDVDAEMLARLGRMDRRLLAPVVHRGLETQRHRALLVARQQLVRTRTALVTHCRSIVKTFGLRLPGCTAKAFHRTARKEVPAALGFVLLPLFDVIELVTEKIRGMDAEVARLCAETYPETARLTQVAGVGPLTALCFVVTLEDPGRFRSSRDVGAYVGLVPRRDQSGGVDKQLRITKTGDRMLRTLLVQCAHHVVWRGPDSTLKRWARGRLSRGGSAMKKITVVAVARKLSVLLHRLWVDGTAWEPLRGAAAGEAPAGAAAA